jgi:hypothetical protein
MLATLRNAASDPDPDMPALYLVQVMARAGVFHHAPQQSANDPDPAGFFRKILFIWLWNCAKYNANIPVLARNRAGNFQNDRRSEDQPVTPQTQTQQGFQPSAPWSGPSAPCAKCPAPS